MKNFGFEAQLCMYSESLQGKSSWPWPLCPEDWRAEAEARLGTAAFGYLEGGAGANETMVTNREAFNRYKIQPRMLKNVEVRDLTTKVLSTPFNVPFYLAPIGVQSILHRDGESAAARAAAKSNVPFVLSTVSSVPMEQIAAEMGDAPRWFQLYPGRDREIVRSFLQRAEASKYSAIVVTVDTTMLGWRRTDLKNVYLPFLDGEGLANFFSDPAFRARLAEPPNINPRAAIEEFLSVYVNPAFTWDDLREIREFTALPILVKGIMHPDDALMAEELGMDGIIVSNHGGRQVDGAVGALDALVAVRSVVKENYTVLMDSGIRSAADVLKALALGANAVGMGRSYAYGLAVGGEQGVFEVVRQWKAELDLQLGLSGYNSVVGIDKNYVVKTP